MNMLKKGFTLIEVLAVIVILGLLIMIIVPSVNYLIKDSEKSLEERQISSIIEATKQYVLLNSELLPAEDSGTCIPLTDLIENGVIDNETIINPKTKEVMDGCVSIVYNTSYNQYEYSYDDASIPIGKEYVFDFKKSAHEFVPEANGRYKIELWGASGGADNWAGSFINNYGVGGYASGVIKLKKNEKIYVYVGEQGTKGIKTANTLTQTSFNGGGAGIGSADGDDGGGAGGGATDVRLVGGNWDDTKSLASRIMVAGGGSGGATVQSNFTSKSGGSGGGISAVGSVWRYSNAENSSHTYNATQTSGYAFGKGENGQTIGNAGGAGAGGGYFGGLKSLDSPSGGAGGGSGYVSGHVGCVAIKSENDTSPRNDSNGNLCADGTTDVVCSMHYSGKVFTSTVMLTGLESMPNYNGVGTKIGNAGNGYAKITYLGK